MGVEENDDKPINPLEVQPEIPEPEPEPEPEPIEQVFSQEPEDHTVEASIESEDQERFEETAKFEEEIDSSKVEPKLEPKQARQSKVIRKSHARSVNEDKPISKLHDELRSILRLERTLSVKSSI